jgi:cilia- and flagella-associated protein 52
MTMWHLNPQTGQGTPEAINTGTMVRDYTCLTYSKNNEDFLYAGTASGDFVGFLVKSKVFAFTVNACALGIKCIRAVSGDKVVVGGGDGQVIMYQTQAQNVTPLLKTQLYGSIHGLSSSPDGMQLLTASDRGFIYRIRTSDFS